jgi:5-amino-6-(5-phosphoribosylamino)uracil reductase
MSLLRNQVDAVLVGGGTFRNWPHPSMPDDADMVPGDSPRTLWNVVVTRSLDLPLHPEFLAERRIRRLVLTSAPDVPPLPEEVEVEVHPGPESSVPVGWILDTLARRGVETLLVEAGGDLLFQFLAAAAIDELFVTLCPVIIGGNDTPTLTDGEGFPFALMPRLALVSAEVEGDEIFLHYRVGPPNRRPNVALRE